MNRLEVKSILEALTGRTAPIDSPFALQLFHDAHSGLGYSQLNELLLVFGLDRVSTSFFQFLLDGATDYQPGQAFTSRQQLTEGVHRFQELAMLLYGNIRFAFDALSQDDDALFNGVESNQPIAADRFSNRHNAVLPIDPIPAEDAYLTGYVIEQELKRHLEQHPDDDDARALEVRRQEIVEQAKRNQRAYLVSDHLDVYVATSMREQHEFLAVSRFTQQVFEHPDLVALNLRWFDPTQAYCADRIDKGLSEALMLRRALCTIYLAQESDTLGKDSELASTLAQGKPVIAYVPEVNDDYFETYLANMIETNPETEESKLLLGILQVFNSSVAWTNASVRRWCDDLATVDLNKLRSLVRQQMSDHYDRRARIIRDTHPLGVQVNLATGVANGVLVVRLLKCVLNSFVTSHFDCLSSKSMPTINSSV